MFVYHHSWGMMLGMFLFWLLAKLFPTVARRAEGDDERRPEPTDPALQIIRHRYASGEITQAEYEELLRTLV